MSSAKPPTGPTRFSRATQPPTPTEAGNVVPLLGPPRLPGLSSARWGDADDSHSDDDERHHDSGAHEHGQSTEARDEEGEEATSAREHGLLELVLTAHGAREDRVKPGRVVREVVVMVGPRHESDRLKASEDVLQRFHVDHDDAQAVVKLAALQTASLLSSFLNGLSYISWFHEAMPEFQITSHTAPSWKTAQTKSFRKVTQLMVPEVTFQVA
eukprot:CAMPEP_0182529818 /NCGR_PEP_ID=MMETSP1323-20130603/5459_1 /TAXON_ID=236787 /ORGANISM="Florenciella parvula, Strain RCC1693" /LENGTH=212 /DNA_ID=CAMNT_0024739053 /DNA_START=13 /DNA_END=653 /DNA_ORIENTATION=-